MVISAFFRAEDEKEAKDIQDFFIDNSEMVDFDAYVVNPPIEVHSEKEAGISE